MLYGSAFRESLNLHSLFVFRFNTEKWWASLPEPQWIPTHQIERPMSVLCSHSQDVILVVWSIVLLTIRLLYITNI